MARGEHRMRESSPNSTSPKCRRALWPRPMPECQKCRGSGGTVSGGHPVACERMPDEEEVGTEPAEPVAKPEELVSLSLGKRARKPRVVFGGLERMLLDLAAEEDE